MSTVECKNSPSAGEDVLAPAGQDSDSTRAITRYGKEELLAFYRQGEYTLPDELIEWDDIVSLVELKPYSLTPASEIEQRNLNQALSANCKAGPPMFKTNAHRPFTRTITNSSKSFSRPGAFHTSSGEYGPFSGLESSAPADPFHASDKFGDPQSLRSQNQPRSSQFSFSSSTTSAPGRCQQLGSTSSQPYNRKVSSPIVAGSWRNSSNTMTKPVSQLKPAQTYSALTEDPDMPEWLDENVSDMNPTEMTFDNQGKFVHVDSLKTSEASLGEGQTSDAGNQSAEPELGHEQAGRAKQNAAPTAENDLAAAPIDLESLRRHIDVLATHRKATEQGPCTHNTSVDAIPAEGVRWYYIDPQKVVRGPFPDKQMNKWFTAGYFKPNILIRRSTDAKFSPLADYIAAFDTDFLFSREPIRGLSEFITPGMMGSDEADTSWPTLADWNPVDDSVGSSSFEGDGFGSRSILSSLIGDTLLTRTAASVDSAVAQSANAVDPTRGDTRSEISRLLGYNDPSIMAISAIPFGNDQMQQEQNAQDEYFQHWQKVPAKHSYKKSRQKAVQPRPSQTFVQSQQLPHEGTDLRSHNVLFSGAMGDQLFGEVPRAPTLYDFVVGGEDQANMAGVFKEQLEPQLAPWATSTQDDISTLSSNLKDIMREEEQMHAKQLEIQRQMQAQEAKRSNPSTSRPQQAPMGWRTQNYGAAESFNKIQLEEIRKGQQGAAVADNSVVGGNSFKPENLDKLRQLQKPQERDKCPTNWAQWNVPTELIWKQEMVSGPGRSDGGHPQHQRQTDSSIANDASLAKGVLDSGLAAWAKNELTSMYGPKVHADTVINLLCKFNMATEMESFIRQSLGTHSKVAQFAASFHRKLVEIEQNALVNANKSSNNYKSARRK